jgi:SAM-dependent methyltransferase
LVDPLEIFKANQKAGWAHFAPVQALTTAPAATLVAFAHVAPGHRMLDVGCGTGVVAVTAARLGARVSGVDLTPDLLDVAQRNATTAGVQVDWREGDAEALPFPNGAFDVVVSQFAHMFAPRPAMAVSEMLRVLKSGGTMAFSTWPPDLAVGRSFAVIGRYAPPPPPGMPSPAEWGVPGIIRERLGAAVRDVTFDTGRMLVPALSPAHLREFLERTVGPVVKLVEMLGASNPSKLAEFRREVDALMAEYFDGNVVRQDYLMTRAVKI